MLLRITSDIHMEQFVNQTSVDGTDWANYMVPPKSRDSEAVLILAGDIMELKYVMFYAKAWKSLAARFKAVVYVPGNHEYCGSNPATPHGSSTFFYFKELLRKYGKIHLLDNTSITIDGVKIYGTSLWTDYNNDPLGLTTCMRMWDFRYGMEDNNGSPRLVTTQDYVERHKLAVEKLAKTDASVIVSHFAPSHQSIHERYKATDPHQINYHFVNNLDGLIYDSLQHVKLWIHGHTHTQFDYNIGNTRVVCNPCGFPNEDTGHFADLDYIEV